MKTNNLKVANRELIEKINSNDSNIYQSVFFKENILIYLCMMFVPVLGFMLIVKNKHSLRRPSVITWLMIGVLVLFKQIEYLVTMF